MSVRAVCVVCDGHVPSGEALLLLLGTLDGEGKFLYGQVSGVAHAECLDQDKTAGSALVDAGALRKLVIQT